MRQLIVETVREVEGVLPDKPVDSLYIDMGDSAMIFRVRWWIESYEDTRRMYDRVNTALQGKFDAQGIDSPYPIHTMNLQVDKKTAANCLRHFESIPPVSEQSVRTYRTGLAIVPKWSSSACRPTGRWEALPGDFASRNATRPEMSLCR